MKRISRMAGVGVQSGYLARRVTSSSRLGGLVVISEPLRQHFLDAGVPDRLILRLPDGADAPLSETRPALSETSVRGRLRVGYVGHLYPGRGHRLDSRSGPPCALGRFSIS